MDIMNTVFASGMCMPKRDCKRRCTTFRCFDETRPPSLFRRLAWYGQDRRSATLRYTVRLSLRQGRALRVGGMSACPRCLQLLPASMHAALPRSSGFCRRLCKTQHQRTRHCFGSRGLRSHTQACRRHLAAICAVAPLGSCLQIVRLVALPFPSAANRITFHSTRIAPRPFNSSVMPLSQGNASW